MRVITMHAGMREDDGDGVRWHEDIHPVSHQLKGAVSLYTESPVRHVGAQFGGLRHNSSNFAH